MNITGSEQDNLQIKRFKGGDSGAFEPLVHKYWRQVYYLCLKYLKNPESAADIAQETFVTAFAKIDTFMIGRSFRPWLLKIAVNKCLRLISQTKSRPVSELIPEALGSSGQNPEEVLAARQMFDECLKMLKLEEQILFVLRHGLNLAYEEMAMILDKPLGTVKAELFRARRKLKERFDENARKEAAADV